MARTNQRGLELSFKRPADQTRGRWYKIISGKPVYFGYGSGISDRPSYRDALEKFKAHTGEADAQRNRIANREAAMQALSKTWNVLHSKSKSVQDLLDETRAAVADLAKVSPDVAEMFSAYADAVEKNHLLARLGTASLENLRTPVADKTGMKTVSEMTDEFVADQRHRMERRLKIIDRRAAGENVIEPKKANISEGRFACILRDVKPWKKCVGSERWDNTEATAARIVKKFRDEAEKNFLNDKHGSSTVNERVKFARQFCGWAESSYRLEHVPRDEKLWAKYEYRPTAKAIPMSILQKLWNGSDDTGRAWIMLTLNCAYYAKDISDLTSDMIVDGYLDHSRGKTGINVKYKLWPETARRLKKIVPKSGPVFLTSDGTALVRYGRTKKDAGTPCRIDNCKTWFYRLCKNLKIPNGKGEDGFTFSNLRDTATTAVAGIDRTYSDLFDAHKDGRQARFYEDGKMIDTSGLDRVIDQLEAVFRPVWNKRKSARKRVNPRSSVSVRNTPRPKSPG